MKKVLKYKRYLFIYYYLFFYENTVVLIQNHFIRKHSTEVELYNVFV